MGMQTGCMGGARIYREYIGTYRNQIGMCRGSKAILL